jgi:hypothetical protein
MLQAKLGAAILASAVAAHSVYVQRLRAAGPTGRLLQFSPGSQDELVASTLQSGALVLFKRNCTTYPGLAGVQCALDKWAAAPDAFDHVGIIVMQNGEPFVLERTYTGVQMRRYDHRVKLSLSKEIAVRQLQVPLAPTAARALRDAAVAASANVSLPDTASPVGADLRPDEALVLRVMQQAGAVLANATPVSVSSGTAQPFGNVRYAASLIWVRDLI